MTVRGYDEGGPILSRDVVTHARITHRQLDYWSRSGWLAPDGDGGHGNPWTWTLAEFAVAVRMGTLVGVGMSPASAARLARTAVLS